MTVSSAGRTAAGARPDVHLKPQAHKRVKQGYPWVYSNEVAMDADAKALPAGAVVALRAASGERLGTAMFNRKPLISARLLSRDPEAEIDAGFLEGRLRRALRLREGLFDRPHYRLVHAEADGLPGLILDRFGDAVVLQLNTAGMEAMKAPLLEAVERVLAPRTIVLRNESAARRLEGLESGVETLGEVPDAPVEVPENGARYLADLGRGQKTGWFFDQRDNRALAARFAKDARVLDAYCHSGGFSVLAALAGARQVVSLDRSQDALDLAAAAAERNGVGAVCEFHKTEVFARLQALGQARERFDLVIADPPAFVKSRKDLAQGAKGYRKLARLAAGLVAPGGFLLAASCSHRVDPPRFAEQIRRGLTDAGRQGRILASSGAAADHPVHPHLPESAYLKAQLLSLD